MKSVMTEISEEETRKYSTDSLGHKRIMSEQMAYEFLKGCLHIPTIVKMESDVNQASIVMETLEGKSLREILGMRDEYNAKPKAWKEVSKLLKQYVGAETDLLERGALYRDMNLDHIIFANDKAYLVDLESTIINAGADRWSLNDMRGTWETMAPEEFPGYGELSARTATYRVAVVAYLLIVGKLPFKRFPESRAETYRWRRRHQIEVDETLDKDTRRVFNIALARKQERRYKDPASFLLQLERSYRVA